MKSMINNIGDELLLIRSDGRIAFANEAAIRGLGFQREKLVGRLITDFLDEPVAIKEWQETRFFELKKKRRPISYVLDRVTRGNKRQTIEVTAVYMKYRNEEFILSIARDVTDRKKMKDQSENLKTVFNFVSGMAQEIHAPLHTIHNQTKRLIDDYKGRHFEYVTFKEFSDIMNTIARVHDQIGYCYDVIDRSINLNKRKAKADRKISDVNQIIREIITKFNNPIASASVKVRLNLSSHLPKAAIGPVELYQVVNHVVVNALQAMPGGGQLKVRTSYHKQTKSVHIQFEDEGVGISRENLPRIFEPFFTTKKGGIEKSSGLGLSVVYSIIKSASGDVKIESSLRKGTVVTIALPAQNGS